MAYVTRTRDVIQQPRIIDLGTITASTSLQALTAGQIRENAVFQLKVNKTTATGINIDSWTSQGTNRFVNCRFVIVVEWSNTTNSVQFTLGQTTSNGNVGYVAPILLGTYGDPDAVFAQIYSLGNNDFGFSLSLTGAANPTTLILDYDEFGQGKIVISYAFEN